MEESSALESDTSSNADTIVRSVYNGVMTFTSIRDDSGTEEYSWTVNLDGGQTLAEVDKHNAGVFREDESQVYLSSAVRAHDAVGTEVPTTLAASEGNVITLTVEQEGSEYVYPITAGAGWEGGYVRQAVEAPMDEEEIIEEEERIAEEHAEAPWRDIARA